MYTAEENNRYVQVIYNCPTTMVNKALNFLEAFSLLEGAGSLHCSLNTFDLAL